MDVVLIRLLFVLIVAVICALIHPFNLPSRLDAAVGLLIGVILIVGGLTFFPALSLGPVVEHLALYGVK